VAVFVFDGVDEVFSNGERAGAPIEVRLVTLEERDEVVGSHGLRIRPDGPWDCRRRWPSTTAGVATSHRCARAITAGGVTSGIDLALWVLRREFGERVADAVAQEMEYERVAAVRAADA
jgi:transcriptional regulator GlxA family with amidase domain